MICRPWPVGLACGLALAGCSASQQFLSDASTPDSGSRQPDGGSSDASLWPDGGARPDGGTAPDGGSSADSGIWIVAIIGDYGVCGSSTSSGVGGSQNCPNEIAVSNLVHSWTPDVVVTVGDNSYGSGSTSQIPGDQGPYLDFIDGGRFFPVLGNHDYVSCNFDAGTATQVGPTLQFFGLAQRYYAVDLSPFARAYLLDTNPQDPDGYQSGSTQSQWLQTELQANPRTWSLVFNHQAPYSSCGEGSYSNAGTYTDGTPAAPGAPMCGVSYQTRWVSPAGVDVNFSGHSHVYERLEAPADDGQLHPFIVVGTSGAGLQGDCGKKLPYQQAAFYGVFGAVKLTLSPTSLSAGFYGADGGLLDSLSLKKP